MALKILENILYRLTYININNFIYLLIFIIFNFDSSYCGLIKLDIIKLRPHIKPKIFLFYELHEQPNSEQNRQFECFKKNLDLLEKKHQNKANNLARNQDLQNIRNFNLEIPFFVEVPLKFNTTQESISPIEQKNEYLISLERNSIQPELKEITKHICQEFSRSIVIKPENINPRHICTAVKCLLNSNIDPEAIPDNFEFKFSNQSKLAKDITLKDLFDEINALQTKSNQIIQTFHDNLFYAKLLTQFESFQQRSLNAYTELLKNLKIYLKELKDSNLMDLKTDFDTLNNISEEILNLSILELSKKLFELDKQKPLNIEKSGLTRRSDVICKLHYIINPLLELNLLKRIIENKDAEKIVVIVGFLHAHAIYDCLLDLGGVNIETLGQHDLANTEENYILSDKDIDILNKRSDHNCLLV